MACFACVKIIMHCWHFLSQELYWLDALDENGKLTDTGRHMSFFPLDPCLAKMLLLSIELCCSEEMLTIASMVCSLVRKWKTHISTWFNRYIFS